MVRKTLCSFWQTDDTEFWCTAIIIFYKFVCSVFVLFCSWELLNCLALGKTQRLSLSLFTQPSNHWKRGRDKYYTDQSSYSDNNWTNREVNIAGLLHFYIQWYSSKWDTSNTLLPWIFHIIATKASQLEKHCATKAFSSATSWSFSEEHLAFFSRLKHVIEYILLGIWPISLFCIYAIYWSQTGESRPEYSTAFLDTQFA